MNIYKIIGNHPICRYITWTAKGVDELNNKVKELEDAGYEVTVEAVEPTTPTAPPSLLRGPGLHRAFAMIRYGPILLRTLIRFCLRRKQ